MFTKIPPEACGQIAAIAAHEPGIVRVGWYVGEVRKTFEDERALACTRFEMLRADGETLTLVDGFDEGWLCDLDDAHGLLDAMQQIRDQIDDFNAELLGLIRKHTPQQLEMFSPEEVMG